MQQQADDGVSVEGRPENPMITETKDGGAQDNSDSPPAPAKAVKLSSISFILTLVSLTLSVFCVALDNVIIVTAIPRITDSFHSVKDIGW